MEKRSITISRKNAGMSGLAMIGILLLLVITLLLGVQYLRIQRGQLIVKINGSRIFDEDYELPKLLAEDGSENDTFSNGEGDIVVAEDAGLTQEQPFTKEQSSSGEKSDLDLFATKEADGGAVEPIVTEDLDVIPVLTRQTYTHDDTTYVSTYEYDAEGKCVRIIRSDGKTNAVIGTIDYTYDTKQDSVLQVERDGQNQEVCRSLREYSGPGRLVHFVYSDENGEQESEYELDGYGNYTELDFTDRNKTNTSELIFRTNSTYDNGNLTYQKNYRKAVSDEVFQITSETYYTNDENGNCIERRTVGKDNSVTLEQYTYDNHGNCLTDCMIYDTGYTINRSYAYDENDCRISYDVSYDQSSFHYTYEYTPISVPKNRNATYEQFRLDEIWKVY